MAHDELNLYEIENALDTAYAAIIAAKAQLNQYVSGEQDGLENAKIDLDIWFETETLGRSVSP